ncbi:putative cation efflux system protein [Nocardioides sp. CF8]|nr:putative cation efflux system protein [Nocardioides sp. CF8]
MLDAQYLRLRWIGHRISAEAGILVDADLNLDTAHNIAHDVENRLFNDIPMLSGATIHVSPLPPVCRGKSNRTVHVG